MINFSLHPAENHIVVKLNGDLDIDSTEVVEEQLVPNLQLYKTVCVDFEKIQFVDSSGMGILIHLVQYLNAKEIHVTISNVNEEVMGVFELLQLPEILGEDVFV
jgi:anti-anti-sigma factor